MTEEKEQIKELGNGKASPEAIKRMRDMVGSYSLYDPDLMIEDLIKNYTKDDNEIKDKDDFHFQQDFTETASALGLSTHIPIAETVTAEYRPFVVEMVRNIIREYDCKVASEIALAQVIASSYTRIIQYSKVMTGSTITETITKPVLQYYNMIGKELDRAHRQFTTALFALKQIKSPKQELNIIAKTAFIAQNQQINDNKQPDVINEPQ